MMMEIAMAMTTSAIQTLRLGTGSPIGLSCAGVTEAIRAIPFCQGYCYTQLTDVMQEINGVLTPDRKPKMDVKRFARLNTGEEEKEGTSVQEVVRHAD